MIKFFEKLLNLIYIQDCYFCKSTKEDTLLCSKCYRKIHFLPPSVLKIYKNCNIYSCCLYEGIIKNLIHALKYKNKKKLALVAAKLMYEYWKNLKIEENFLVLPVPIHKSRLKERKYNHMDLICKEFCKLTNYKLEKNFLIRTKDTKKQYNLHKQERIRNIKDAFDIKQTNMPEKESNLLILDDITATGITIEEIIKLLNKNGYRNITVLTLSTPDIWN